MCEAMTSTAATAAFEAIVARKSTHSSDDPRFAVGYYVSLQLLRAVNAASPDAQQVAAATLERLVLFKGNARVFCREALALHARVDAAILAESDSHQLARLRLKEQTRMEQVAKRIRDPKFCERVRRVRNGDVLLARMQQMLEVAVARYCGECDGSGGGDESSRSTPASSAAAVGARAPAPASTATASRLKGATYKTLLSTRIAPPALPSPVPPISPLTTRKITPVVRQLKSSTISTIRRETSVARAYTIQQQHPDRFTAYCAFFKNDSLELATEISRKCKDKCQTPEIREWMKTAIGSVPAFVPTAEQCATRQTKFRNSELRKLALVAVALTVYGEHVLSALYDWSASSMLKLQDIPLVSEEIRDARKQRECLQRARWADQHQSDARSKGNRRAGARELHAAHYLPLDLSIRWNNALPPERRLSAAALCWILNHPSNMKAVPRRVNTEDHRRVEHFIAAFIKRSSATPRPPKAACTSKTWLAWRNMRDRLAQIAARVQSRELRDAFAGARGGEALYDAVEQTFRRIEAEFVARGYEFEPIWDCEGRRLQRSTGVKKPREFVACIIAQSSRVKRACSGEEPRCCS